MKLSEWLADTGISAPALEVPDLCLDSRRITPGAAFVAVAAGRHYVQDAVARGAAAIITESMLPTPPAVPVVTVPDLPARLGTLASRFWGNPAAALDLVAVTGTDGKTSTSQFISQALNALGHPCANIGTLGVGWPGAQRIEGCALTTPDVLSLQRSLARLREQGARAVAIEASSHGLSQGRLDGAAIDVAVLTQLGRDHLDYHGTMEAYAAAKRRLFERPELCAAVLNADDPFSAQCQAALPGTARPIAYSCHPGEGKAHLTGRILHSGTDGLTLELHHAGRRRRVETALHGRFNLPNLLAAAGALLAMGIEFDDAAQALSKISPVAGRMELFVVPNRPLVALDYAHTPNALDQVLRDFRSLIGGRLWCVMGMMGNRDRGKRPLMATHLARWADRIILTDSMTHGEDPEAIIQDLLRALPPGTPAQVIRDRETAIHYALDRAHPTDGVLVIGTGKGNERETIELNGRLVRADFDCVKRRLAVQG